MCNDYSLVKNPVGILNSEDCNILANIDTNYMINYLKTRFFFYQNSTKDEKINSRENIFIDFIKPHDFVS